MLQPNTMITINGTKLYFDSFLFEYYHGFTFGTINKTTTKSDFLNLMYYFSHT